MNLNETTSIIEGLLFVTGDEGLSRAQLAEIIEVGEERIDEALNHLQAEYAQEGRGLQLVEMAGAYRLTSRAKHVHYIKKLAASPIHSGLSQAALETLAIVAYQQPITRVEIDEIRGVKSEKALQSLSSKLLIKEVGRASGSGRAILYGTTNQFLDHFGLKDLEELPPLPEEIDEDSVEQETDLFFSETGGS